MEDFENKVQNDMSENNQPENVTENTSENAENLTGDAFEMDPVPAEIKEDSDNSVKTEPEDTKKDSNDKTDNKTDKKTDNQKVYVVKEDKNGKGMPDWTKILLAVICTLALCVALFVGCTASLVKGASGAISEAVKDIDLESGTIASGEKSVTADSQKDDYIGILHIEGSISEDSTAAGYNHDYIIKSIRDMAKDEKNRGILLYVDSPGGTIYAADATYCELMAYKEATGRPIYATFESMAASGGYYISSAADKIIANRNCWTGSIGVTIGSMYDVSELLDSLGIKVQTITSGDNKAMGSSVTPTKDQVEIYQALVDEAYEQFVGIVAEGRNMSVKDVKKLADGRIYSANQALENGLVDEVVANSYDTAKDELTKKVLKDNSLDAVNIVDFKPAQKTDIMSILGIMVQEKSSSVITPDQIQSLVDMNNRFEIYYLYK